MHQKKQFNRYVPILIKQRLDELDYTRKDNLYTIIDLINRKEIYFKSDLQRNYGYSEICLAQFKELLPTSNYLNEDLNFLIDEGLIMRNEYFTWGYKSKAYKIPSEYLGKAIGVKIQNENINKRIAKQIEKYKRIKVKSLEFAKSQYFKNFKVDIEGAHKAILEKAINEISDLCVSLNFPLHKIHIKEIIECSPNSKKTRHFITEQKDGKELLNILHRYMVYTTRINAINDGFLFFKRNKTNGRLDTNLTSLPSFLRQFIISDEPLMNIDIKNSQPYFLYVLLKNKSELEQSELEKYKELTVSGELYDFLKVEFNRIYKKDWTREQMKIMLFKIFYSKTTSFFIYKQFFSQYFPTIMEYISNTNTKQHNTLAVQLQTIESFTVLDIIMPLLGANGIRPYTIHDSFVCKQSESDNIMETINNKFVELYGVAPSMHKDYISLIDDDDDDLITDFEEFLRELNSLDTDS